MATPRSKESIPAPPSISEQRELSSASSGALQSKVRQTIRVRDNFGNEAAIAVVDGPVPGRAKGRPQDFRFAQRLSMVHRRLRSSNIMPATIVNTLPVALAVNSPLPELAIRVNGCVDDQPYVSYTWAHAIIEVSVQDAQTIPNDYVPRMMAEEFVREYQQQGGVMLFEGSSAEFNAAYDSEDPEIMREFNAAEERGIQWMIQQVSEAEAAWHTADHANARNITEKHRLCAIRLKLKGRLPANKTLEWMDLSRASSENLPSCFCGTPRTASVVNCPNCGFIHDVARAFAHKLIDENHLALERLTREEVIALGVSAYVAETADEMPARLQAALPKPLSIFQQRQQQVA